MDDIPAALALSTAVQWNQSSADWALLMQLGRGFALIAPDRSLVATAMIVPYERFAWISTVIVSPAFRRQGLATRLLQRCIDAIRELGAVPILDATPAGRAVYRKLGFVETWELRRHTGAASSLAHATVPDTAVRPATAADVAALRVLDRDAFGADRSALLRCLLERDANGAVIAERSGAPAGFAFVRAGRTATQIGPVVARDEATAIALIAHAARAVTGRAMVDVPVDHLVLDGWLARNGFTVERPFSRMQLGTAAPFGCLPLCFAIAGPELG